MARNYISNPQMIVSEWAEYVVDAAQRNILFWDTLRQRGNRFLQRNNECIPSVLSYEYELVEDGEELSQPVNYKLLRIVPPSHIDIDPKLEPIVIFDPRAGHGPGISGFKSDSEVGVALRNGHSCYVIAFTPEPVKGQTIEDIMKAEVAFIEKVISLHPQCDGKPILVGNCQGGWALMMMASYKPELCGPIVVAGSPLSYWEGVHGKNPMRYSGGMLGGTWLTRLTSDLGNGIFDGAWLVANFEGMNPANTLWDKQYNLYSAIDTEKERYLKFEDYWGGYSLLNGEEMQFIVDNLFVGNRLSTGEVITTDGVQIDFRNIKSPILCFCSQGDNITPPQQALGWISDLYDDVQAIKDQGQTIVYCVHENVGHLGIFVSESVSKKEQRTFGSNMDFINLLPPGLYEAVISEDEAIDYENKDQMYISRFEPRNISDIKALGCNDQDDEKRFATVRALSDLNNRAYQFWAQPVVKALSNDCSAQLARDLHPNRLVYRLFSDDNPLMWWVQAAAKQVSNNRKPCQAGNDFLDLQQACSRKISENLKRVQDDRDEFIENWFLDFFGDSHLQAMLGTEKFTDIERVASPARKKVQVKAEAVEIKNILQAFIRAVLFVNIPSGVADERRFKILKGIMQEYGLTAEDLKPVFSEQYQILIDDEYEAIKALSEMVISLDEREKLLANLEKITKATGEIGREQQLRLYQLKEMFSSS